MKKYIVLILILAFLLRFIALEKFSPPLNRDELALSYNAYSLLETGKDEHGQSWPISFQSIGDYKMPGYIYLTMISVKIFGLTVFATKFWSSFSGFLAVLILYLLTTQLTKYFKDKNIKKYLPIFSTFLFAINPWHIHYSRIGFEANVNLTLFLAAIYFLFKSKEKPQNYILTSLCFLAMQFMYSSTFVFLPLIIPFLLLVIDFNSFKNKKNHIYMIAALTILIAGSFVALITISKVSIAKKSITIFSDPTILDEFNHIRSKWNSKNILIAKLWYNRPFYLLRIIKTNYLKSFSPGFLLFNKLKHPWHSIPNQGYFYYPDYLLILIGTIYLIKLILKNRNRISLFLISWLLLSPAASAITVDAPHATRSLYLIPILIVVISVALIQIIQKSKFKLYFTLTIYFLLFSRASYQYLYNYPRNYSYSLFPEIDQVFTYFKNNSTNQPVYFEDVSSSPYLYYLFYQKIDPKIVQNSAVWTQPDGANLIHISQINNYYFINNFNQINSESGFLVKQNKDKQELNNLIFEAKDKYGQTKWQIIKL